MCEYMAIGNYIASEMFTAMLIIEINRDSKDGITLGWDNA